MASEFPEPKKNNSEANDVDIEENKIDDLSYISSKKQTLVPEEPLIHIHLQNANSFLNIGYSK